MYKEESGSTRVAFMAFITFIGGTILVLFPTMVSGAWQILAWVGIGATATSAGVFHHKEKIKKQEEDKETQRKMLIRNKNRKKERLEQEKRIEQSKEKLVQQDEKQDEKRAKVKANIIKEAKATWSERNKQATSQEKLVREIVEKANHMAVREAAGQMAIEWYEASTLAQWTLEQITMFSQLPDGTKAAREEAQDAIVEAMRFKESGGLWTLEKGKALAEVKDKAKSEAQTEEKRIDTMRDKLTDADIKWRAVERRIDRWKGELNKAYESLSKTKN